MKVFSGEEKMNKTIVFLGPPGAGKGTQSALLSDRLSFIQISTGDLLREAVKNNTPLGVKAKYYMEQGSLVPDELIIAMIDEKLQQLEGKNIILDGFPRTVNQAKALDDLLPKRNRKLDTVILFQISDEEVIKRLSGRRVCQNCGAVYHIVYNPPKKEGVCDKCGGTLIQREDDKEEVIRKRLEVYHNQTVPLIDYYKDKILSIDATADKEYIYNKIVSML